MDELINDSCKKYPNDNPQLNVELNLLKRKLDLHNKLHLDIRKG